MFRECANVSIRKRSSDRVMSPLFWSFGLVSLLVFFRSFLQKNEKKGTSSFLHNFVHVGLQKDIQRERERERRIQFK